MRSSPFASRDFGPNGGQVARFIEKVGSLSPEQWSFLAQFRSYTVDYADIQERALKQHPGLHTHLSAAGRALETVIEGAGRELAAIEYFNTMPGVIALVCVDALELHQFSLLYAPYVDVIPVEELGPGRAPSLPEQHWFLYLHASEQQHRQMELRESGVRNGWLLAASFFAVVVGAGASLASEGWAALLAFSSVAVLFVVSLLLQRSDKP